MCLSPEIRATVGHVVDVDTHHSVPKMLDGIHDYLRCWRSAALELVTFDKQVQAAG